MNVEMYVLGLLKFEDGKIVISRRELKSINDTIRESLHKLKLCKEEHKTIGGWHVYLLNPAELCIKSRNFKVSLAELGYYHHRVIMHFNLNLGDDLHVLRKIREEVEKKINELNNYEKIEIGKVESLCYVLREIREELEHYVNEKINEFFHFIKAVNERIVKFYKLRENRWKLKQLTEDFAREKINKLAKFEIEKNKSRQLVDDIIYDYTKNKINDPYNFPEDEKEKIDSFSVLREVRKELKELSNEIINFFVKDQINRLVYSKEIRKEGKVDFVYTYPLIVVEKSIRNHELLPFSEETTSLCFEIFEPSLWPLLGKIHLMRISIPSTILYVQKDIGESLLRDIINAIYQYCLYEKRSEGEDTNIFENTLDEKLLVKLWEHFINTMGGRAIDVYSTKITHRRYFLAFLAIGVPIIIFIATYLLIRI